MKGKKIDIEECELDSYLFSVDYAIEGLARSDPIENLEAPCSKRMQPNQHHRYARGLAADARRQVQHEITLHS